MDQTPTETELQAAADDLARLLGLRDRRDRAREDARAAQGDLREALDLLDAEADDVRRLVRPSWARTLAGLHGTLADDLERERAEEQVARYDAAVAAEQLRRADDRLASLEAQLSGIPDAEHRYTDALAAMESETSRHGGPAARHLAEIAARRGRLEAQDRELREAHAVGILAQRSLRRAHTLLLRAEGYAGADMFGGGLLVGSWKYDRLDRAADELREARTALADFARELAEVGLVAPPPVAVGSLERTFDLFFDNLFTDARVRRRIERTREETALTSSRVQVLLEQLVTRQHAVADQVGELSQERQRLLLNG